MAGDGNVRRQCKSRWLGNADGVLSAWTGQFRRLSGFPAL